MENQGKRDPGVHLNNYKASKKRSFKELFCGPLDHEMNTPFFGYRDGIKSTTNV